MIMKLFSLSFLLILIHGVPANSAFVRDADGDVVTSVGEYFIRYSGIGFSGGIGLSGWSRLTCPASVIQMSSEVDRGLPVNITPLIQPRNFRPFAIYENASVFINFPQYVTGCPNGEAYWHVDMSQVVGKFLVGAGELAPGPSSHFVIVPAGRENVYTLAICPPIAGLKCLGLGIHRSLGQDRLSVNDQPNDLAFTFSFVKKGAVGAIKKVTGA
ncbi:factor Xa inhibitor BuXI-like [Andrographis paniculata]|uniref:factor Xa inhibitor BuXI-like n=1 Tax=Andrographis paniculata TaxID=175694 RepID=UPI0021E96F7D|nr:factor Xa inhibitor BuXI-like [Andrographis paniculata]